MRAQNVKPFDISLIEEEVQEVVQQRHSHIQPVEYVPRPVPDYVNHRDDVSEIGKLSAEAIVKEYEATAKEIEAMGQTVNEMVQRCDQLTASASAMLKDIKATAARYRKEGKRMFNEIEQCSTAAEEVRKLCENFQDKLAAKATEEAA
jgi:HAMP domain-containing protein